VKPTYVFLAALAGVLLGLFVSGWPGAVLLLLIVAALLLLLAATWRRLAPGTIAVRLLIIAGLVTVAVLKIIWQ
jgi:asparagine N-glycosylation enzyme membrane subunit Stt3